MILYGGDNIYPDQVEEVIDQIPGVIESAVIGVPDDLYGEVPRIYRKRRICRFLRRRCVELLQGTFSRLQSAIHSFHARSAKNKLGKIMKKDLRELVVNA